MTDELVLYTHPFSRGRTARWMLEEVGVPYRSVILDYGTSMKAPDYLAINPMGKVPALTHNGMVVTECAAILAYLADAFPTAALAPPPGDPARGAYYRWLFFGAGPIEAASTSRALGLEVPPEKSAMAGFGSIDLVVSTLDATLQRQPYLIGDRFTAADLFIASQLYWTTQYNMLPALPSFQAFINRAIARPAAVRAAAIDDALVKDHPLPDMPA